MASILFFNIFIREMYQCSIFQLLFYNWRFRTLVLPPFYQHALLGVTYRRLVDARLRIDVNKLRELVSVISMDQAMDVCKGNADAIFIANSGKVIQGEFPRRAGLPMVHWSSINY